MPEVPTNITNISKGVTDLARDAAYVAVGLGVLGYQRAQVQRVELQNRLSKDFSLDQRIGDVRQGVAKGIHQIDDLAETAVQFVETTLQPLEDKLPSSVSQVTTKAREQAREVRIQIRQRVERLSSTPLRTPTTLAVSPPPRRSGRRRALSRAGCGLPARWRPGAARHSPAARARRPAAPGRGRSRA